METNAVRGDKKEEMGILTLVFLETLAKRPELGAAAF